MSNASSRFSFRLSGLAGLASLAVVSAALLPGVAVGANDPSPPSRAVDPGAIRVLLSADPETTMAATMSGTVQSLGVTLGQTIAKGRPLVQMDCAEPRARLGMADA